LVHHRNARRIGGRVRRRDLVDDNVIHRLATSAASANHGRRRSAATAGRSSASCSVTGNSGASRSSTSRSTAGRASAGRCADRNRRANSVEHATVIAASTRCYDHASDNQREAEASACQQAIRRAETETDDDRYTEARTGRHPQASNASREVHVARLLLTCATVNVTSL
jgi:hypothetical protein